VADERESLFDWVTRVLNDPDPLADLGRLGPRAARALAENLAPEETVRVVIRGKGTQAIAGTDTRALVLKPGLMPGADPAAEVSSWNYRDVAGVEVNERILGGSVVLRVPGQDAIELPFWGGGSTDPRQAPNAIPAAGDWDVIRARAASLALLIDAEHANDTRPESAAELLRELEDLHRHGVLSDEEVGVAERRLAGRHLVDA
jgi:hypothetical protein